MAYKFLTRLAVLTAAIVGTTHMGIWSEPMSGMFAIANANSKATEADKAKEAKEFAIAEKFYVNAIERGLYFSHRLPDWKKQFLMHTSNIINDNMFQQTPKDLMLQRSKDKQRMSLRSFHYPELAIIDGPKPPMIKDDITCRKRDIV